MSDDVEVRRPRKRAVKKAAVKSSSVDTESSESNRVKRRAPTPLGASRTARQQKNKRSFVVVVIILVSVGLSAAVGYTDKGQIDVGKVIEERNERIRNNQASDDDLSGSQVALPVQNTNTRLKADGGLRGSGGGGTKPTPAPPPPAATSTATSSDQTASSTDTSASSTEESVELNDQADEGSEPTSE